MKTLVLNLGSSSLKYKLFADNGSIVSSGIIDQIGVASEARFDGMKETISCRDHMEAFDHFISYFLRQKKIRSLEEITTVGHRVVHGGEYYYAPTIIDQQVLKRIQELFSLSPLHNPINYRGIVLAQKRFPHARQVAVFDTAFYQSIPPKAFLYGIPYKYYQKYGVRKYGFHGISHKYIAEQVLQNMLKVNPKKKSVRHISCHLGNGSSITAIRQGKALDTTMGFTPLQGMIMGTRSGTIDPAIVPFLQEKEGLTSQQLENLLNKKSGILGISQISSDVRDIYHFFLQDDERARLTLEMISYQIARFIGTMAAVLGGVDVITFTGGIGENAFYIRKMALEPLQFLGVTLDEKKNQLNRADISAPNSKVKVWIVSTDEEKQIYREVTAMG